MENLERDLNKLREEISENAIIINSLKSTAICFKRASTTELLN
jgi:hypothetical protein